MAPVAIEHATLSPGLRAVSSGAFERWTRVIAEALAPQLGPSAALDRARVLLSLVEGALLMDRGSGRTESLRAIAPVLPTPPPST